MLPKEDSTRMKNWKRSDFRDRKQHVLDVVSQLAKTTKSGIVRTKMVINFIDRPKRTTSKHLADLVKDGLLEKPLWGCWWLTEEGREALKEAA